MNAAVVEFPRNPVDTGAVEAEVLGVLFRHPQHIALVELEPEDFGNPVHSALFAAMRAVVSQGLAVDIFAVAERLGRDDALAIAGSLYRETVGTPENLGHWAGQVMAGSRTRKFSALLDQARTALAEGKHPADRLRGRLVMRLAEIENARQDHNVGMEACMSAVVDRLEEVSAAAREGRIVGVPTGIAALDAMIGGLCPSDLTVAAGRSGMGKTALAISIAHHAATLGYRVGFVSTEMAHADLGSRLVSIESGIDADRMRRGLLSGDEFKAVADAAGRLRNLPLVVYDRPSCSVPDIALRGRSWALSGGLDLLIVDYIQRLRPESRNESRTREVGEIASGLKNVARTLDVPVLALAQVNRQCEQRQNKRPNLSDLRESGDIEHEADQVVFLYRDRVYNPDADPFAAELIVEKNRHGPPGTADAGFTPATMHWRTASEREIPFQRRYAQR